MDGDNKEKVYSDDDGENRIYSYSCDKLAIDTYCNNPLKSQSQIINFHKRQQFYEIKNSTFFSTTYDALKSQKRRFF